MMSRIFGVMGMSAVGYYDLTQANVPVHSTAFRAVDAEHLSRSPFRVFCSLLRTDLIKDMELRLTAERILSGREIYSDKLKELVEKAEAQGGLSAEDAELFITEATKVFQWHADANDEVSKDLYIRMRDADPSGWRISCVSRGRISTT